MSIILRYLGLNAACALIAVTPLLAQTSDEMKMLGVSIKSLSGSYLVLKDVNVRAKPATGSKRIGRFKSGERVEAIGRVKGPGWRCAATEISPGLFSSRFLCR